jgi:hypothetical protein
MNPESLRPAYQNFFTKSEEGKAFMAELGRLIDVSHEKAEKDANGSRDYTQQARGIRQVIEHIQSVSAERGKTKK